MIPPGLAFASVSQKALDFVEAKPGGRYYFDWVKTAKSQRKGNSPFTPAVTLFQGLDVALDLIEEEGLDNVFARHDLLARATRAGVAGLGLELYGNPDERSTVVTALELPETIDGGKVPGALRKLGITANGGQDHLKGKILRVAHCGYFGAFDILTSLSGIEMVLAQLGHEVDFGAGVGAAQRVFVEAGVPRGMSTLTEQYRVLVAEKIAETGVDMLRENFDVDVGTDWSRDDLLERIGSYHGILIRSATKLDAEVIERADNLRVVGRAGVGVDNVDVAAASKRGIIVANAPEANTVAAAEHTVALMLALARNIPQAHASLTSGKWERSKFGGTEVEGKTLGVLGFGRIGQLVAIRARAFGMRVIGYDPFVSDERFRELGAERAETPDDVLAAGDFITLHLPKTPETQGFINTRDARQVQGRRADHQRRPRAARRRRGPQGRARFRQGRRRRARRLRAGADHRPPAVRLSQRRRHAAPRRVHGRGPGPRRRADRRAGRGRAHRRRRLAPPSTSPRSARRTARCSGRSSRSRCASAGSRARWPTASSASRSSTWAGSPSATPAS